MRPGPTGGTSGQVPHAACYKQFDPDKKRQEREGFKEGL